MNYLTLMLSAYLAMSSLERSQLDVDHNEWQAFKEAHNKSYESEHIEHLRRTVYAYNKHQIKMFNAVEEGSEMEINHLADMSSLEVQTTMNGFKGLYAAEPNRTVNSLEAELYLSKILEASQNSTVPDSVDWRTVPGRVGKVLNQGKCIT